MSRRRARGENPANTVILPAGTQAVKKWRGRNTALDLREATQLRCSESSTAAEFHEVV